MEGPMKKLFKNQQLLSTTFLRLTLAGVMFPHGAQKVLGLFGGYGFSATMGFFTDKMHIPALFAFLAILAEFGGSIALALGFVTRVAAFGIGATIAVAAMMVHFPNGFFMNWNVNQKGEGFEYHILVIGIALVLILQGAGRFALDNLIAKRFESNTVPK
jgi:putative oxidoreductase